MRNHFSYRVWFILGLFGVALLWINKPGGTLRRTAAQSSAERSDLTIPPSSPLGHDSTIRRHATPPTPGVEGITTSTNASLVLQELRTFDDPAAEQLVTVFDRTGWSPNDQILRFKEAYDQLGRIFFYDDLIAENRLQMRSAFESIGTNLEFTPNMRKESRYHYSVHQNVFEADIRRRQTTIFSNLVVFLGTPPSLDLEEFKQRLRDVHPRLPLDGSITNFLPQPPRNPDPSL